MSTTIENHCKNCMIPSKTKTEIKPLVKDNSRILCLIDYPSPGDEAKGAIFSGLDTRARNFYKLMDTAGIHQDDISIVPAIRCVTKSKDMKLRDYEYCTRGIVPLLPDTIQWAIMFGAGATSALTGTAMKAIDQLRGKVHKTIIPEVQAVATYSLGVLTKRGCSGCNHNVFFHLMEKDLEYLKREMEK